MNKYLLKKKLIGFLLVLTMILMLPLQAFAVEPTAEPDQLNYLNLGDSIAFGLSAVNPLDPGNPMYPSYYHLYGKHLESFGLIDAHNFGVSGLEPGINGLTSGDLLDRLQNDDQYRSAVSQADIITISIGGNNLLGPIAEAIEQAIPGGLPPTFPPTLPAGMDEATWNALVAGLMASAQNPAGLGASLAQGSADFVLDWPKILDEIQQLNPDANVIALTLYNPVEASENPALYGLYELLIAPMNFAIMQSQLMNQCSVADVYTAFQGNSDAVGFKLSWEPNLDFHPTITGHGLIFTQLMNTGVVERIAGEDRYETAVKVSQMMYEKTDWVVIANAYRFSDVLAAAPLASAYDAPILYTETYDLPEVTRAEIERLGADNVIFIGGQAVVDQNVVDEGSAMVDTVIRIGGVNRYETAKLVGDQLISKIGATKFAIIASGANFPDALAIAGYAGNTGTPILLTEQDSIPQFTSDALDGWGVQTVLVVGGENAVSGNVSSQLDTVYDVGRIGGIDRFETATLIQEQCFSDPMGTLVTNGLDFADSLAAGPFAAKYALPIVLVYHESIPQFSADYIGGNPIHFINIIGGPAAVSNTVEENLRWMIND